MRPARAVHEHRHRMPARSLEASYPPFTQGLSPKVEELTEIPGWTGLRQDQARRFQGAQRVDAPPRLHIGTAARQRWSKAYSGGYHDNVIGGKHFDVRHRGCGRGALAAHAVHPSCPRHEGARRARPKAWPPAYLARAREVVHA